MKNLDYYFGDVATKSVGTKQGVENKKRNILRALEVFLKAHPTNNTLYLKEDVLFQIDGNKFVSPIVELTVVNGSYLFVIKPVFENGIVQQNITLLNNSVFLNNFANVIVSYCNELITKHEEERKEAERKRKEEQTEMFETLLESSPYLRMNLKSRDKLLEEIIQKQQTLNRMDRNFLQECEELMQKLSGKETAANFVEFMKHRLNS